MTLFGVVKAVACPPSKLDCNFPWTLREASNKYFMSLMSFAVGSFIVPLLFLASVLALCQYPAVLSLFIDSNYTWLVVGAAWLVGTLLAAGTYYLAYRKRKEALGFTQYARLASHGAIGGMLFALLFVIGMHALRPVFPQLMQGIATALSDSAGNPNMTVVMILSTVSFVIGFGMQMQSIDRSLKEAGTSLRRFMALNLDKRRGSTAWRTAWHLVWPAALCFALWHPVESVVIDLLGPCEQPTMKMAREATGGNFLLFAVMAAIGAPIFEELVFRGFLFQVIRGSLKSALPDAQLVAVPNTGSFLAFRRRWAIADNWLRSRSQSVTRFFHRCLGGWRADITAVLLSSIMFAVLHLQFQPTALVLLFLLGAVHAELYRRTGSLYCSMLLHALNNGFVVIMLALGY